MGASRRGSDSPLSEELYRRPNRFQFIQLVRLLRKWKPGRASVGRDADPGDEVVRFRSDTGYGFATGDVLSLSTPDPDTADERSLRVPDEMVVSFLGIATPNSFGSLPTPYVEEIRGRNRDKNFAFRDFIDLFNHRLASLFYRAWERSRPEVLHDLGERSAYESVLHALIGLEGEIHRRRLPCDSRDLLGRAGLLSMRPAGQSAIEGLVESLIGIPARVEQFLPTWYEMDTDDRSRLGQRNSTLGADMSLGSQVCLAQWRFRVRIGPMDFARYRSLLPGSAACDTLASAIRLAVGPEYDFELNLVLDSAAVPPLRLGSQEGAEPACRLGWSSWLDRTGIERDADDAIFTPDLAREEDRARPETTP
jgi:type VI secretion system protein ImpH